MSTDHEYPPHLEVLPDAEAVAERAAALIAEAIARPHAVLGVATGRTPLPVYARLRAMATAGMATDHLRCFALDEYCGIGPDHPGSYHAFLARELFDPLGMERARWDVPDGLAADCEAEGARYEAAIRAAGGVDLQLLGMGRNGHIGFNEPGSPFDSLTRCVTLTEDTRAANIDDFRPGEEVARHALTQGMGTILRARKLLMVVTGPSKAVSLAAALTGPVTPQVPASALRLHPDATILVDAEAAARLPG